MRIARRFPTLFQTIVLGSVLASFGQGCDPTLSGFSPDSIAASRFSSLLPAGCKQSSPFIPAKKDLKSALPVYRAGRSCV